MGQEVKIVRRRSDDDEPKTNFLALKKQKIFVPLLARSNFAQRSGKELELPTLDKQFVAKLMTRIRGHFGELRLAVDQNQVSIGEMVKKVETLCEILLRQAARKNKDFEKLLDTLHIVKSVSDKVDQLVSAIDEAIVSSEMLRQLLKPQMRLPSFAVLYLNDKILQKKSRSLALVTQRSNEALEHEANCDRTDLLIIQQIRNIQERTMPSLSIGTWPLLDRAPRTSTSERTRKTRSIIHRGQAAHMAFL